MSMKVITEKTLIEKYRPKNFSDVRGNDEVVRQIQSIITRHKDGRLPDMLFTGPAGTGKTTVAHIVAKETYGIHNIVEINASDERGIDVVRNKIKALTQKRGRIIIFLDEADALTHDAQDALKRTMERSIGATFILTCNEEWKIIEPLHSRCSKFRFNKIDHKIITRRLAEIAKSEGLLENVKTKEVLISILQALDVLSQQSNGDMRSAIGSMEKIINEQKTISVEAVLSLKSTDWIGTSIGQAVYGDLETAIKTMEDSYIISGFNYNKILEDIRKYLRDDKKLDISVKAKLFADLSELDKNIRIGGNPIIQLIGFLSKCWIYPHMSTKCQPQMQTVGVVSK